MRRSSLFAVGCVVLTIAVVPCAGKYGGGLGTAEAPYLIADADDLDEMRGYPEDWDKHFVLKHDIDFTGRVCTSAVIASDANPDNYDLDGTPFTGVFDGQGYTISNLEIDAGRTGNDYLGLFGQIGPGAIVKDLKLQNARVLYSFAGRRVSCLIGCNAGGSIRQCHVNGTVSGRYGDYVGLVVGCNEEGDVIDCEATGLVSFEGYYAGGVAGKVVDGNVQDCRAHVEVTGVEFVGGLVGYNASGRIEGSMSSGAVAGGSQVGGLVGFNGGTVADCRAEGVVSGQFYEIGGLVGCNDSTGRVSRSAAAGELRAEQVGASNPVEVGGLAGSNRGAIECCESVGGAHAVGSHQVGGLAGLNTGTIVSSRAEVDIMLDGGCYRIGGLVGQIAGAGCLTNCYATGVIKGVGQHGNIGGLVGTSQSEGEGRYQSCYAAVALDFAEDVNVQPLGYADFVDSFWNVDLAPWGQQPGALTTADMKMAYPFLRWASSGVWVIDKGNDYPRLAWEGTPGEPIPSVMLEGAGTEESPWLIRTPLEFDTFAAKPEYWGGHLRLECDLDLQGRTYVSAVVRPFPAQVSGLFSGCFDGNGHTIRNLLIDGKRLPYGRKGLFGGVSKPGRVEDLSLVDCVIRLGNASTSYYTEAVGTLAGINTGIIKRCYSSGTVEVGTGWRYIGGLVGINNEPMMHSLPGGRVEMSSSTCSLRGSAPAYLGGLVGSNLNGEILNSLSRGTVIAEGGDAHLLGGLTGYNSGTIRASYATSAIEVQAGAEHVGGLVGATTEDGVVEESFWDKDAAGLSVSAGGEGKSTLEMLAAATYLGAGWDFVGEVDNGVEDIWAICEGTNYPRLAWQVPLADITCPDGVGLEDFAVLAGAWLSGPGDGAWDAACDLFESAPEIIDAADVSVLTGQWLEGRNASPSVGPAGAWRFDDGQGSRAIGSGTEGLGGTLVNLGEAAWVEGHVGGGLAFDGVDDYVTIGGWKGIAGGRSRTVCAWVKTEAAGGTIVAWGTIGIPGGRWVFGIDGGGRLQLAAGAGLAAGSTVVCDGAWRHVAVVVENDGTPNVNEVRLYVDGAAEAVSAPGDRVIDTVVDAAESPDAAIGVWLPAGAGYFEGVIDEVRVYERALSGAEVALLAGE